MPTLERENVVTKYYSFPLQPPTIDTTINFNIRRSGGRKPGRTGTLGSTLSLQKRK
jgi:hypothetical protein